MAVEAVVVAVVCLENSIELTIAIVNADIVVVLKMGAAVEVELPAEICFPIIFSDFESYSPHYNHYYYYFYYNYYYSHRNYYYY